MIFEVLETYGKTGLQRKISLFLYIKNEKVQSGIYFSNVRSE